MFSPDKIRLILAALEGNKVTVTSAGREEHITLKANPQLKAMVLLGINGGFGNTDIGDFQLTDFDLRTKWVDNHRAKTVFPRRFPLWPETVKAIEQHLKKRHGFWLG